MTITFQPTAADRIATQLSETLRAFLAEYGAVTEAQVALWTRALAGAAEAGVSIEEACAIWLMRERERPRPFDLLFLANQLDADPICWTILRRVALSHGVPAEQLLGRLRAPAISRIRFEAWAAMSEAGASYAQIGRLFRRDHTTVMHGVHSHRARMRGAAAQNNQITVNKGKNDD